MNLTSAEILALRPSVKRPVPGITPLDVLQEQEARDIAGGVASILTVLLRGSECSYRCLMCDLWKSTHSEPTPPGNIPKQIEFALQQSQDDGDRQVDSASGSPPRWIKLYNASNFFAPINVPTEDLKCIAELVRDHARVVVENHPRLLTDRITAFAEDLNGKLEVAMGLETIEPRVLKSLNKQLTVDDVQRAVEWLLARNVDARLFVLLRPPGMSEQEGIDWCHASIAAARNWGVRHVSIIPVRTGNGAIEKLQAAGIFTPPRAASLEQVLNESVQQSSMVVTADLWDWHKMLGLCEYCADSRRALAAEVNLTQQPGKTFYCRACE